MMSGLLPGFLSEQHVTHASADHSTVTHHGTARHEYGVGHRMEDKQNSAAAEQNGHHNQSHDSTVEGLHCYYCQGSYADCGRMQHRSDNRTKSCVTGKSCIAGRQGDNQNTYSYFRDCDDDTCQLGTKEVRCVQVGVNVTCQLCCSSSLCNAEAFNRAAAIPAPHPHLLWTGAALLALQGRF